MWCDRMVMWCELASGARISYTTVYELCLRWNMSPLHFWMTGNITPLLAHRSPELLQCWKIHVVRTLQLAHNVQNIFFAYKDINAMTRMGMGLSCCQMCNVSLTVSLKNLHYNGVLCFFFFFCSFTVSLFSDHTFRNMSSKIRLLHQLHARNISVTNSPFHWIVKKKAAGVFPSLLQSTNATHSTCRKTRRSLTYVWGSYKVFCTNSCSVMEWNVEILRINIEQRININIEVPGI